MCTHRPTEVEGYADGVPSVHGEGRAVRDMLRYIVQSEGLARHIIARGVGLVVCQTDVEDSVTGASTHPSHTLASRTTLTAI